MADKYQKLLIEWCDRLLKAQITDKKEEFFGAFRCESCAFPHGRADNAVYPFVCAYALTGDQKHLRGAERLLVFRKKLTLPSGAVQNDFSSPWQGITAFSAIGLLKTLLYFGDKLPLELKTNIKECAVSAARWVHENMVVGFPAYVNYYCAAALVNALYARLYGEKDYALRAKELLSYCLGLFTENGLLAGEGKPHNDKSPKGCLPIDVGYVAEESLPCLVHAAALLEDETALSLLAAHAKSLLDFMLPDGGWDNSFGVRNNKWTYYGSRTSDGCIGAFALLAKRDPLFAEAAERTFEILKRCTTEGLLYGGPQYFENGQKPCVHHTFCHAGALADAIHEGITEGARTPLPCDEKTTLYKYYPELNTYKIRTGGYLATLTGYDYATHNYVKGAAHAGGGTLSLLWKDGVGAMIAGSTYEYKLTEPNNMQLPAGSKRHATLIPRAEYEKDGVTYATCLDKDPEIAVRIEDGGVTACVKARFFAVESEAPESDVTAEFRYRFTPEGVTVSVKKISENVRFVLPIVEDAGKIKTQNRFESSPIFFLTGGFGAEEYAFSLENDLTITIL